MENGFPDLWFVDKFQGVMEIFPKVAAFPVEVPCPSLAVAAVPVDGASNSFTALLQTSFSTTNPRCPPRPAHHGLLNNLACLILLEKVKSKRSSYRWRIIEMQNTGTVTALLRFPMNQTTNELSMKISKELKNRKVSFHSQGFFSSFFFSLDTSSALYFQKMFLWESNPLTFYLYRLDTLIDLISFP